MESNTNRPHSTSESVAPPAARRSWRSRASWAAVVGLGILATVVWWGRPPRAEGPLSSVRDAQGRVQRTGEVSGPSGVSAQATLLDAKQNATSSTVTASSGGSQVFANSVAILNLSDHLLAQRIGLQLFELIQQEGSFSSVQYIPHGSHLPDGGRLPDLFITLDLNGWRETGVPGRVNYAGQILLSVGPEVRRHNQSVNDSQSPPRVNFHSSTELDYRATQTGFETAAAQYQTVSRDIAKNLSERMLKETRSLGDKHGRAPAMPAEFYPPYEPPPQWKFLKTLAAEKLVDGSTFMQPTHAVWRVVTKLSPTEFWPPVLQELADTGWKVPDWSPDKLPQSVHASQGGHWLRVFPERRGVSDTPVAESAAEWRYVIVLDRREGDVARLLRSLLDGPGTEAQLLLLQNHWYLERDRVAEFFKSHPPQSAAAMLVLAGWWKEGDDRAAVMELLLKAHALQQIAGADSGKSRLKELQKKLGLESLPAGLSDESLVSLKFPDLRAPGEVTQTAGPSEPAVVWLGHTDQGQHFLHLTPSAPARKGGPWQLRVRSMHVADQSRGWSESTTGDLSSATELPIVVERLPQGGQIEVLCRPREPSGQFELRIRRTPTK